MSSLGSWGLGSTFHGEDWWFDGVRQERIWHPLSTWKGEGGLSTLSETPEMVCWFACVIAHSLRSSTKPEKRIVGKRAEIARRVGKVRTRWLRHRKTRRAAAFTAVRVGEASHPGPLSKKHLPCPRCPNAAVSQWHLEETHPTFPHVKTGSTRVLCEWNFSEADAVEEGRRSR